MKLEDALGRYLTQLRANGRSEHTVLQAQRHLRLLAAWLEQQRRAVELDAIDEDVVAAFLTSESACNSARGGEKKPGTMNSLRSSLKTFFGAATCAEWMARDPGRFIKRARCSAPPPRALTPQERERFLAALNAAEGPVAERDRMLFTFMLATGVRLSSALALEVGDVDLQNRTVLLRSMKNGDVQRVFMPEKTATELDRFIDVKTAGPVFARIERTRVPWRRRTRRLPGAERSDRRLPAHRAARDGHCCGKCGIGASVAGPC